MKFANRMICGYCSKEQVLIFNLSAKTNSNLANGLKFIEKSTKIASLLALSYDLISWTIEAVISELG